MVRFQQLAVQRLVFVWKANILREMPRFKERGTAKRLKEGLKNDWRWDWLDREQDGNRIGDAIQKQKDRGKAFCVPCAKTINWQSWLRGRLKLC